MRHGRHHCGGVAGKFVRIVGVVVEKSILVLRVVDAPALARDGVEWYRRHKGVDG